MIIHTDTHLRDFEFWSGGAENASCLTYKQIDQLETVLTDIYPEGIDDVRLNDLMWFDNDIVAEWLGYKDFEQMVHSGVKPN